MSPRTIFLSKLLGLYCIILALAMFVNGTVIMQDITELGKRRLRTVCAECV
jgi:hypothetical protein